MRATHCGESGRARAPAAADDFGAEQVEIDHQKFGDGSITWNTIDPSRAVEDSYFHLAWHAEPLPPLAELPGRALDHVELLEWAGDDMANGSIAVGFDFGPTWLIIFNALDENGFEHDAPAPSYRRHRWMTADLATASRSSARPDSCGAASLPALRGVVARARGGQFRAGWNRSRLLCACRR
ncbi:hypothetical protein ACQP2P_15205 [Dactylosporangium sp. CA-139114]|uniref:hypothetical protein n=1 Tax=Dactylosporangium sp. CA-139114 TaxID=3239931 RepID=UPI003D96F039